MNKDIRLAKERLHKKEWYKSNKQEALRRVNDYKSRNQDQVKARQAKYRKSHPDKLWFGAVKQRAKAKGLEFSISENDVIVPKFCPILGIPLFRAGKKHTDNSPSIDRIDSTKGYVKGNIQIISHKANIIKNNAKLSELIMIGEWAKLQVLEEEGVNFE